ncbi:hypothetical protein EV359DRAFT_35222, partial [Lentinula novae-zelandiae]
QSLVQGLVSGLRPTLARSDTENLLSYYQSPLADSRYEDNEGKARKPTVPSRQLSIASSESDYSDSSHSDYTGAAAQKRLNIPSEGGSDRRRVAIVEMDTVLETAKRNSSLRSRRGKDVFSSLALVAPPDASPKSYSQVTPPLTAPIEGKHGLELLNQDESRAHHRSQSEAVSPKKPSRDVGIVGTTLQPLNLNLDTVNAQGQALQQPPLFIHPESRSPTPGDLSSPTSLMPPVKRRSTGQSITVVTPEIGAGKPIDVPVASPVVVRLDRMDIVQTALPGASPSSNNGPQIAVQSGLHSPHVPSSYLNYKPGIHATAGPLPPPPRAAFVIDTQAPPPPRPPRLNSPVPQQPSHMLFPNTRFANTSPRRGDVDVIRQALQLPPSVAKALAARPMSTKPSTGISPNAVSVTFLLVLGVPEVFFASSPSLSSSSMGAPDATKSAHRREGAFSPSSEDAAAQFHSHHTRTIASHGTSQSLSVDGHTTTTSVSRSSSVSPALPRSHSPSINSQADSRSSSLSPAPSPPPKSFRHSITTGLKRMSLPRTPSAKSLGQTSHDRERSSNEDETSNHPLPDIPQARALNFQPLIPLRNIQSYQQVTRPYITPLQPMRRKRKIDPNPDAMFCSEVTARQNAGERCMLYAQKINDLWGYDCGLEEWMENIRNRGMLCHSIIFSILITFSSTPTSPISTSFNTMSPSTIPFTSTLRQTSRSSYTSVITEATFPRRPDASAATDLAMTFKDALSLSPPTGPPPLPYPSLVSTNQRFPGRTNSSVGSTSGSDSPARGYKSLMPLTPASKTGAFFASLGRKASVSRKDKGLGSSTGSGLVSSSSRLTKQPHKHSSQNSHPPATVTAGPPSVPGGPRAPPNRMLRSQTMMISPMLSEGSNSSSVGKLNVMGRRPSLHNIPSADSSPTPPESSWDLEFRRQVDKLSDLMPHADRIVLAGYLKRSGQDILAIGQYLEDEKNGRLRRD